MIRRVLILGVVVSIFMQHAALAQGAVLYIKKFKYDPKTELYRFGDPAIEWFNSEISRHHTSTSNIGLWDSGDLPPQNGIGFGWTFHAAGVFPYHCKIHHFMHGTVVVRPADLYDFGNEVRTYTVYWSNGDIPVGFSEEIQIKRPHAKKYVAFGSLRTVSDTNENFIPDAGLGTYTFRARLHNDLGGASGWQLIKQMYVSA